MRTSTPSRGAAPSAPASSGPAPRRRSSEGTATCPSSGPRTIFHPSCLSPPPGTWTGGSGPSSPSPGSRRERSPVSPGKIPTSSGRKKRIGDRSPPLPPKETSFLLLRPRVSERGGKAQEKGERAGPGVPPAPCPRLLACAVSRTVPRRLAAGGPGPPPEIPPGGDCFFASRGA